MEVLVYNNTNQLIARGDLPDYDSGDPGVHELEASDTRFFKVDASGNKTSESVTYESLVASGAINCEYKNASTTSPKVPFREFGDLLVKAKRFRSVIVTVPTKAEIQKNPSLKALLPFAGKELPFTIALPADHNWHELPGSVAKLVMKAIDASEFEDDFKKALKTAARTGEPNVAVTLGFVDTNLQTVMLDAERAADPAAPTTTTGPHPAWSADAELSQINVGNLSHSTLGFMAQINAVKRRLRALIRELRAILAGGDTKMRTVIEGLEALIARSESNMTGIVASERREQYQELAAKYRAEASQRTADAEKALAEAVNLKGQAQVDKQKEGIELREQANRLAQIASLIESLDQPLKLLEESHRSLAMELQQDADYSRRADLQNRNTQF